MSHIWPRLVGVALTASWTAWCGAQVPPTGAFRWSVSAPFLSVNPEKLPASAHPWIAVKDPSIVRFEDRWHLFCTLRKHKTGNGRIRIGYLSFTDWSRAQDADWKVLNLTMGYHGAPQIFWFEPQQTWYLIYQAEDSSRQLKYGPCFSTNPDLSKPEDWTLPEPLYVVEDGVKAGLDFWVICDDTHAYLFFTSLDGRMWRARTLITSFPSRGWTKPEVALKADIFEASHTYRLTTTQQYLTIVEAQGNRRRYFKAYLAQTLDGKWSPLAATREQPLVSPVNVLNQEKSWPLPTAMASFSAPVTTNN